jgi:hypothetical protein
MVANVPHQKFHIRSSTSEVPHQKFHIRSSIIEIYSCAQYLDNICNKKGTTLKLKASGVMCAAHHDAIGGRGPRHDSHEAAIKLKIVFVFSKIKHVLKRRKCPS